MEISPDICNNHHVDICMYVPLMSKSHLLLVLSTLFVVFVEGLSN